MAKLKDSQMESEMVIPMEKETVTRTEKHLLTDSVTGILREMVKD